MVVEWGFVQLSAFFRTFMQKSANLRTFEAKRATSWRSGGFWRRILQRGGRMRQIRVRSCILV